MLTWPVVGLINGNEIVIQVDPADCDPADCDLLITGTISPDGKKIIWTHEGTIWTIMGRTDVDECTWDPADDPCASQPSTICYNTDPGFTCNYDVDTNGWDEWHYTDQVTGKEVTVVASINSGNQPKAAVTYTTSDCSEFTGFLLGNIIELIDHDGFPLKTGIITKNSGSFGEDSITWNVGPAWGRFPGRGWQCDPTDTPIIWPDPISGPTYSGGDGLTPWIDDLGDEWTFIKETNAAGDEIVTILTPWFTLTGVINGNKIIAPDPNNPGYPITGTISADGKTIMWTQQGLQISSTGRTDVDECTWDPAHDPCADQAGTTCYNTDPSFICNCDVYTDGKAVWYTADGYPIQIDIDSTTQPKVAVTYFMEDGTVTTGSLLGNTIEFSNPDGSHKIGIITKTEADGSEIITWNDGTGWSRSLYSPVPTIAPTVPALTVPALTVPTIAPTVPIIAPTVPTTALTVPNIAPTVPDIAPTVSTAALTVPSIPECGTNEHWVECGSCTENDCKHGMACLTESKKCANNWSQCCIIENQCVCDPGYARYTGAHINQP